MPSDVRIGHRGRLGGRRPGRLLRLPAVALLGVSALSLLAQPAAGRLADLPDPCGLVPAPTVAAAVGAKAASATSVATTPTTSTCSYGGLLTVEVGVTALTNPFPAVHTTKVTGIPHGVYSTFANPKQTQIVFYEGTAATGVYVVVRAFTKVKAAKLVAIALLAHGTLTTTGTPSPSADVHLVSPAG